MSTHTHYMQFEQYKYIQARFKLDSEFRVQSSEFNFRVQWGHSKPDFLEFLTLRGLRTGANHPARGGGGVIIMMMSHIYDRVKATQLWCLLTGVCLVRTKGGRVDGRHRTGESMLRAWRGPTRVTGQWQSSRSHGKRGAPPRRRGGTVGRS